MKQQTILFAVRPYIAHELPGWGRVYDRFVGGHQANGFWAGSEPRIIRDKRYGYHRILDLREWGDRSFYFLRRWYDLRSQGLVDKLIERGQRVLDVGANYGHFALSAAAAVGKKGEVLAFEPNPESFARLKLHVELNNLQQIKPYPFGISDRSEYLTLNVPSINSGEATFATSRYDDPRSVTCEVRPLDEVVAGRSVHFVKIDVEGFEVHFLRGSEETFETSRPLALTEIVSGQLDAAGHSPMDIGDIFASWRYVPYLLGLERRGNGYEVCLKTAGELAADGDYLWVPEEKCQTVEGAVIMPLRDRDGAEPDS